MISFYKIVSPITMSVYMKSTLQMFYFVLLFDLSLASSVNGTCVEKHIYENVSKSQEMIRDIKEKAMDSGRILIDLINLSQYVLKDTVSLSSFNYYNKHSQLISDSSNNIHQDNKHHSILLVDSGDNIGVISLGVFINKTTPLWQNEAKQKSLR